MLGGGALDDPAILAGRASRVVDDRRPRWRPTEEQLLLLASLLDAGLRIDRAFVTLAGAARTRSSAEALDHVATRLREGGQLHDALAEVGVPGHVTAPVVGGDRAGRTSVGLRAAAEFVRRLETLRAALRNALVYPVFVLLVGLAIITVMSLTVVPSLERTFADLGGELPLATVAVLRVSSWIRDPWVAGSLLLLILVGRSLRNMLAPDRLGLPYDRIPVVGVLRRDLQLAVFARSAATMLEVGLPLVEALRAAAGTMPQGRVRMAVERAANLLEQGSSAFSLDALGTLLAAEEREILRVAAENGLEAEQWSRVADRRAEVFERRIRRVGALIEPLLVVLVGLLIGGAVLALYLPTFRALDLL